MGPMRIHHVDCASLCPAARRAINGEGSLLERGTMPAHCLIVETKTHGVVVVDTGFGRADAADPDGRFGRLYCQLVGVRRHRPVTLLSHLRRLGLSPEDVRHIIVTHLDVDHAGALPDFPHAIVHVHQAELEAAQHPTWRERSRYSQHHWAHGPRWQRYDAEGEPWRGFPAVRQLVGLPPEFLCLPLPGHSRGHWLVVVESAEGPLVHCGDAYFHRGTVEGTPVPWGIPPFEALIASDRRRLAGNHERLRELACSGQGIRLFSAHDPVELQRLAAASP